MWVAALRRFTVVLGLATILPGLVALAVAALAGTPIGRAVSVAFYLVGAFCLFGGFFIGNRGPVRPKTEGARSWVPGLGHRVMRWASREEQEETINLSAVFVVIGILVVVFGILVDPRQGLL
jgi:hypothetical protein